jgi:hypothetical protein
VQAQAREIIAALDADAARLRGLYEAELRDFACQRLAERGGRAKTLRLLQGTVAFRTVPASLRVADAEAALPHARALGCTRTEVDACAYRQAAEKALTVQAHATHLIVHGMLHLLGYDHESGEDEAATMEQVERNALAMLGIADPYRVTEVQT